MVQRDAESKGSSSGYTGTSWCGFDVLRSSQSQHQCKMGKKQGQINTRAPPSARCEGSFWDLVGGGAWPDPTPALSRHPAQQTCCTLADPAAWSSARTSSTGLGNPCPPSTSRGLKAVRGGGMEGRARETAAGGERGESRRGARGEQEGKNTPRCPGHRVPSSSSTLPERSVCFHWMNCSSCTCGYQLQYILHLTCII